MSSIRLLVNKVFYTSFGQLVICAVFGFALAIMFRKVCKGDCTIYFAPHVDEVSGKIFKLEDTCYKYTPYLVDCNTDINILAPYDTGNYPENKLRKSSATVESFINDN
jgi:hypothetical protein